MQPDANDPATRNSPADTAAATVEEPKGGRVTGPSRHGDAAPLSRLIEDVVKHRFSEARSFLKAAEQRMREVGPTAGQLNGITTAADARAADISVQVSMIDEHLKKFFPRPDIDAAQRVDADQLEAVRAAKAQEESDG